MRHKKSDESLSSNEVNKTGEPEFPVLEETPAGQTGCQFEGV